MLETIFGSRLRAKVLGRLLSHPYERYFVRQLATLVEEDSTNVSRELARLEKTGILVSTTEGRQKYYQANRQNPLFNELHGLIVKAEGMADLVDVRTSPLESYHLSVPRSVLADFCRKYHIRKLSFFGSVLRDDFRPDSDVDVLVEFEPKHTPGFAIIYMEDELSRIIGRKVDMRTSGDLSRYFRNRVVREARTVYAQSET